MFSLPDRHRDRGGQVASSTTTYEDGWLSWMTWTNPYVFDRPKTQNPKPMPIVTNDSTFPVPRVDIVCRQINPFKRARAVMIDVESIPQAHAIAC